MKKKKKPSFIPPHGHVQQVIKYLDPNKKKYNRKKVKPIPNEG